MRYRDGRRSLCLSSQSGCPLTCTFCATGAMRFGRNLTASEIVDQALHFRRSEPVNHAVYMGMGEPFLNFDNVLASARRLPDIGITPRRTTISTVGWMPGLRRFVDEVDQPIRLAFSIHAAEASQAFRADARERPLPACGRPGRMPSVRRASAPEGVRRVRDARRRERLLRRRARARRCARRAVIQGEPDSVQPDGGKYDGSSRETIERFKSVLARARIPATVRLTRGRDIEAACGQLAAVAPARA